MNLRRNKFKRAIEKGERQVGLWSGLRSTVIAEMLTHAGYDWIVVDMEHSPNELVDVMLQLQVIQPGDAEPMVRVPWNDPVTVKRILDVGAQTLLFPMIQNAEEAELAVASTRYPDQGGIRGVMSLARMNAFGKIVDYYKIAHTEICVVAQCETVEAVENIPAIAAVEGVDGIFIGPSDLSASMGLIGQAGHKDVQAAIKRGLDLATAAGKPCGFLTADEAMARRMFDWGYCFVAVGSDLGVLTGSATALYERFKEHTAKLK